MTNCRIYHIYVSLVMQDGEPISQDRAAAARLAALAVAGFQEATVLSADVFRRGQSEPSFVVAIVGTADDAARVRSMAVRLKTALAQAEVLYTATDGLQGSV